MTEPGSSWSGTYHYRATQLHEPDSLGDVRQIVSRARRIRAVGTRHSFTDVGDSESLISLARLPGQPVLDPDRRLVRVPAAARYGDLAAFLHRHGFALGNLASLPHISVAGSVATATHGSGDTNPTLASAVRGMTLVTSTGDLLTLGAGHTDFDGAVVHLGALGVVIELVLAVQPTFVVRQNVYEHLPFDTLLDRFDDVLSAGYSVSVMTDWAGDRVDSVWVKSRVDEDAEYRPAELLGAQPATTPRHPTRGNDPRACTPQLGVPGPWYDRLPHFRLAYMPSSGAEIHSEYFVHRADAAQAITAIRLLASLIAPRVLSAEIRSVAADGLWLSPAYRQDCVGFHFTWKPDAQAVAQLVPQVETVLEPFAARPHWAKVFDRPSRPWAELYPRLPDFERLLRRYDARGAFRNGFLDRLLAG